MIGARHSSGSIWAVMGMEVALAAPLVSLLVGVPDRPVLLGPAACVAMLVLGYVTFYSSLPGLPRYRVAYGVAACLGARLLVTAPPQDVSPSGLLAWVTRTIVPALVGLVFWWRGGFLAEAELTAADVRNEFALVGGSLMALLTLFRGLVAPDSSLTMSAVVLFVLSGLIAVGSARQDDAGSARARGLVTTTVLVFAAAAVALVGVLRPAVVEALWQGVQRVLGLVGELLLFLLQPLVVLLSGFHFEPPARPLPARPVLPNLQDLGQHEPPPAWVTWLVLVLVGLLALAAVVGLLWLLFAVILPGWLRPRARARSPFVVEATGEGWEDARHLLAGLGRWLTHLGDRAAGARPRPAGWDVVDARSAYRAFLHWARERGFVRAPAETPRELEARLCAELPLDLEAYATLTHAYELERYGQLTQTSNPEALRHLLARLRERSEQPPSDSSP